MDQAGLTTKRDGMETLKLFSSITHSS